MKRKIALLLLLALVAVGGDFGYAYFQETYLVTDYGIYRRDAGLLDLRDTEMTVEAYEAIQAALPECQILWRVPIQGQYLELDTQELKISALTRAELESLRYLPKLSRVSAQECTDLDILLALKDRYPQVRVDYLVPIGGEAVAGDTKELAGCTASPEELTRMLPYLPELKALTLATLEPDNEAVYALTQAFPDIQFYWNVGLCGNRYDNTIRELDLSEVQADDETEWITALKYFPNLEQVTYLPGQDMQPLENEAVYALIQAYPDVQFCWKVSLFGNRYDNLIQELDLSGIRMEDETEVENALKYFPNLERVVMCGCGIPSEDMDAMWKRNPEIRFVWSVRIANFTIRTDVTTFMPWKFDCESLTNKDAKEMSYLVDVICMDVGHMGISDLSFLEHMPNMQYLIVADCNVTDISPMAGLKKLKYLEAFKNHIEDISPLASCTALRDLNLCYNPIYDFTPLYGLQNLEHLWLMGVYDEASTYEIRKDIVAHFPDVVIMFNTPSSTGKGWRQTAGYYEQRDLLGMGYMTH